MEAGEKELREAFESTTTQNVKAILEYSNGTRKMVREVERRLSMVDEVILNLQKRLDEIDKVIAVIRGEIYMMPKNNEQ